MTFARCLDAGLFGLATAASDSGSKVDAELLFIRVLAELDEPHVRLLRLMSTKPPSLARLNHEQQLAVVPPIRQGQPPESPRLRPGGRRGE